jgi:hypothetical protein
MELPARIPQRISDLTVTTAHNQAIRFTMNGKRAERFRRNTPSHSSPEKSVHDEAYRLGFRSRVGLRRTYLSRDRDL